METLLFSFQLVLVANTICFTTFIISFLYLAPKSSKSYNHGFKTYPLLGSLPHFLANRHRFLDWITDVLSSHPTHTSVFSIPGKVHGVITAYPSNVEHILKTRFSNYPKGTLFISQLHDFLGDGIFTADGDLWRLQRKTASFEFNKRSLRTFILECVRSEITTRLIPLLKDASKTGRVLDMQDVFERFAFDNVCRLAFDVDPACLAGDGSGSPEFMWAFEEATALCHGRFMYALPWLWKLKKFLNIGSENRLKKSISTVHSFADNIIRMRLQEKSGKHNHEDLLSRFMISTHDQSSSFESCNFLRDVVVSFILAGRDTTSSGLTWFFWVLSRNQDVLKNIRTEVREIRTRSNKQVGETFNFDELREMTYLHAAISESIRLYPPVPVDTRACLDDDVLPDGTEVKKDWFMTYNAYTMGRMESIWGDDCLEFRPERWLDGNGSYKTESPFRYPVFHAGPRVCLGKEMAYVQIKSITASVVELFEFEVVGKEKHPEMVLALTLRMKEGLHMKLKKIDL